MDLPYADRTQAGRLLARAVRASYGQRGDAIVLALPRGGVAVALEVSRALEAPLDVLIVRKLGVPNQPELAMGALASGGVRELSARVLLAAGISEPELAKVTAREQAELERRERVYRGDRPQPSLVGRSVFLVDDGLATGSTMLAAVRATRERRAGQVVVAVPVAPAETVESLSELADDVVCPATPRSFLAIGQWYEDFRQYSDDEVRQMLARAWGAGDGARRSAWNP